MGTWRGEADSGPPTKIRTTHLCRHRLLISSTFSTFRESLVSLGDGLAGRRLGYTKEASRVCRGQISRLVLPGASG